MNRGLLAGLLVAAAVIVQITVVNRLPMPWGVAPDLVVLTVVAVALRTSAVAGALSGFVAGLAVDVAPPADHELGRYALVLCLAGYLVGLLREPLSSSWRWPYGVAAAAITGVSLGYALVGVVLGDPRISLAAVASILPVSVIMTMIVSPLVIAPVSWVMRSLVPDDLITVGDVSWASGRNRL
ncbi:rod shape-determining protein MreD [Nocardiopsis ansamitocini]|uniref:Rod shape-determining protein MreD n=1 Tax=Nocardiopsis ansamitocini TaxID=1670832 RepID=A0A9W6P6H6_9ACTN|nr:rod shape-determining protein MreD [Nocardiopsis ansamitocini]GLU47964.1 rod shape-determining protein MreD [Nocardiopsis ansamitocini]